MLFEDLMILLVGGIGILYVARPLYMLVRAAIPHRRNPLAEARERLEQARLEVEAAKLIRETERLYDTQYNPSDEEEDEKKRKSDEQR